RVRRGRHQGGVQREPRPRHGNDSRGRRLHAARSRVGAARPRAARNHRRRLARRRRRDDQGEISNAAAQPGRGRERAAPPSDGDIRRARHQAVRMTRPSVPVVSASNVRDEMGAAGWRIVLLASLGGTLEFYDFVIFGIFARDIADAIFPNTSPTVSLMASFAAFATGYLARPIGGIVLSHYGDRFGRRRVFLWSVFVMSGATLGMGLVPSYAQWGV